MKLTDQELKDITEMAESSDSLFDLAFCTVYDALIGSGYYSGSMPVVTVKIELHYEDDNNDEQS